MEPQKRPTATPLLWTRGPLPGGSHRRSKESDGGSLGAVAVRRPRERGRSGSLDLSKCPSFGPFLKVVWRRRPDLNRRMEVLQTHTGDFRSPCNRNDLAGSLSNSATFAFTPVTRNTLLFLARGTVVGQSLLVPPIAPPTPALRLQRAVVEPLAASLLRCEAIVQADDGWVSDGRGPRRHLPAGDPTTYGASPARGAGRGAASLGCS